MVQQTIQKILNENINLYNKVIHLVKNSGKGKAVIEGIKKSSKDYVIIQDADLEYDPKDILVFLEENKKFNYDLIMGSRFIGTRRTVLHFWHMIGNRFITFIFNLINNTTFSDIYCCYCMFKRNLIKVDKLKCYIGVNSRNFNLSGTKNSKIYEIAVNYHGRTYQEEKRLNIMMFFL